MAIRNAIPRSSMPLLCSIAALALAFGCSSEQGNGPDDDDETAGTSTSGGKGSSGSAGAPAGAGGSTSGTSGTAGKAGMTGGYAGVTAGTSPAGGGPSAGTAGTTGGGPSTGGAGGVPGGSGGSTGGAPTGGAPTGGAPTGGSASGSGGAAGTGGQAGGGAGNPYNPDFEEFTGEDCEVAEPADVNDAALPDLFESLDGTRITQKSQWSCRRAELKKIVEKYIHGEKPGKPELVSGTVTATSVTVHVEHMGKSADFSVSVSIPSGAKRPAPAIIGLGGGSLDRNILSEEGVATMNYNNSLISSETSRSGIFSNLYGSTGASAQVGWAWGVSRIIDVLVAEKEAGRNDLIDPTAIGVTGCSRLGKGAFTIGAFDERIALGIPQESGTGGVSAFRVVNTNPMGPNGKPAQSLASAWTEAQGWFGTAFGNYRNNVNVIPGDTHSLVAMYAPRGLLVLDNSRIGELGSSAQHAASAAGARVYAALGVENNIAYHGGRAMDPHMHCSFYSEQAEPLRKAIQAHLTRTAAPAGAIEPQPAGTADLARWIDWDTPVLE
jgi:hypothetical protein